MPHRSTPVPAVNPQGSSFSPGEIEKNACTWAMICHLAAFAAIVTGIGGVIAPLVIWLIKRHESSFIDHHGRESVNFQITVLIAAIACGLLVSLTNISSIGSIGIVLGVIVAVINIVLIVIAATKASDGDFYTYPIALRLIR